MKLTLLGFVDVLLRTLNSVIQVVNNSRPKSESSGFGLSFYLKLFCVNSFLMKISQFGTGIVYFGGLRPLADAYA